MSGFAPKPTPEPQPPADQVRAAAAAANFRSREPAPPPVAPSPTPAIRTPQRWRTGRTAQFNTRITPQAFDRFYQLAEQQGWRIGETVERALAALERELAEAAKEH